MYTVAATNMNTTDLTIETWAYMTTTGTPGDIYICGLSTSGNPWSGIRYFSSNFEAFIGDTGGNPHDVCRIPVVRGPWVHLVMSYHGTSSRLVFGINGVNSGVQAAAGGGTRAAVSEQVFVGRYNSSFNLFWPAGSGACGLAFYDQFDPSMAQRHYRAALGSGVRRRRL
jgi:hypothetical protein